MKYFAPSALLPEGWASVVAIDVDDAGNIVASSRMRGADGREVVRGPGRAGDAQRCIRTRSSARSPGAPGKPSPGNEDSFWTWRQAMYAFLDRIDAEAFEAIAAQAYIEMAKAGIRERRRIPLRPS